MRGISLGLTALVMACSTTAPSAPVASLTIQPETIFMIVGGTFPLTVTLRDAEGNELQNRPIMFTSSNANVVSVTPTGFLQALAVGEATIKATSEGKTGQATISVQIEGPPSPWDY